MLTFKIQIMTHGNYHDYIMGGYNYSYDEVLITADTFSDAVTRAEEWYPDMVINKYYENVVKANATEADFDKEVKRRIEDLSTEIDKQTNIIETAKKEIVKIDTLRQSIAKYLMG